MTDAETDAALAALLREHGPRRALALLAPIAAPRVLRRAEHLARVAHARELLRARVPRQAIVARLAADGVSRSAAYRVICEALQLSHEPADCGTRPRQDAVA